MRKNFLRQHGLFMLILLCGVIFAFRKPTDTAYIYFGELTTDGMKWRLSLPSGKSCLPADPKYTCIIASNEPPSIVLPLTDQYPATYVAVKNPGSIFR
ncbi:hypothetical protein [Chitinophaga vietnamensis]|uniref:hypothetical protein n=1 Tax=Chitinophaga vietnamensis TaxID=2593957 RepID=UPI0011780B4F|nr:hypothetical protein [Chitinophaga vietnamensis]